MADTIQRDSFVRSVNRTIQNYAMLRPHERVLVGVSGGADSVALLYSLYTLRRECQIRLVVAHVHHGLRGKEADRDERFVKKLAQRLRLPYVCIHRDVRAYAEEHKESIEEAARHMRYDSFARLCCHKKIRVVAVGHTKDDQAETMLMRITRGTGIKGLCAIRPVMKFKQLTVVRPLLMETREAITTFLKEHDLSYVDDSTNAHEIYLRNKIRHSILPLLKKKINPHIVDALVRLSRSSEQDHAYIMNEALRVYPSCVMGVSPGEIVLGRKKVASLHHALSYRVCEHVLRELGVEESISFDHWERIVELIHDTKRTACSLPGCTVLGQYDRIFFRKDTLNAPYAKDHVSLACGETIFLPQAQVFLTCSSVQPSLKQRTQEDHTEVFDYDRLSFPLTVRFRCAGDRMIPLGMSGHKKIKDILMDKKIPLPERDITPLVCSSDTIVWLAPHVMSETAKVTKQTKRVVHISFRR